MRLTSTLSIYWGIGGLLVSYGLLRPRPTGWVAATLGVLMLAAKGVEALSWVANQPSLGPSSVSNFHEEGQR